MASDELRFLVDVPDTIARGALHQLRCSKESFRVPPDRCAARAARYNIAFFIKRKSN